MLLQVSICLYSYLGTMEFDILIQTKSAFKPVCRCYFEEKCPESIIPQHLCALNPLIVLVTSMYIYPTSYKFLAIRLVK